MISVIKDNEERIAENGQQYKKISREYFENLLTDHYKQHIEEIEENHYYEKNKKEPIRGNIDKINKSRSRKSPDKD